MSELRLNILDAGRAISGTIHGSVADAAVAALSAEPETIEELQEAMARFIKPVDGSRPFDGFAGYTNDVSYDAGIILVDLAARIVAAESTYSLASAEGQVAYHDGEKETDVWLPYRAPDDWLFVHSVAEYRGVCKQRRAKRSAVPTLDARPVLYDAVVEFIVRECSAARDSKVEDPVAAIHAKWLMTPRADLGGKSPREVLLGKRDFIDFDLQSRELQWSFVGEPAPFLSSDSAAYRFAGFGTHEVVVYYDLIRLLISECWKRVSEGTDVSIADEAARLKQIEADWLECPEPEFEGRNPRYVLECERRRIPLLVSAHEIAMDDDCPLCQAMAADYRPTFWHLDGCNMDDDFPFSFCDTREEWEGEELRRKQFDEEFEREWKQRKRNDIDDDLPRTHADSMIH